MPDSHLLENSPGLLRVLNNVVMMGVSGYGGVAFQVQGTFTGTITFESSVDGQEFVEMRVVEPDNSTAVTTTTAAGVFVGSVVGMTTVRARMSAYTNGSAAVTIRATLASPGASGGGGGTGSDVNLIEVGGETIQLGQAAMAASLPVVIASDQSPIPITGSISATNPSVGPTAATVPTDATYVGVLDPDGNLTGLALETFDYDTSGATKAQAAIGIAIPSSSGALPVLGGAGTAAQALRVELPTDGTGRISTVTTVTAVTAITNPVTVAQATAANLNATVIGAGSAGTANAGVVTIQGITSMTPVLVNQPTGTNLHVVIDSGTISLPSGAATLAEQQTQTASLSVLDDWDETDRAKVNIIVGQAGVTAGAGSVAANTPRVTHASDDPVTTSVQLLDDTVGTTGSAIPTKGIAALGTDGTNGRVLKTDSGGELQIDVLSIIPGTTATNLGKAEDAQHASGDTGVMALGVANVAQTSFGVDADYMPLATDLKGNNMVVGNIASDGVDAGNPVKVGAIARSPDGTTPGSVAEADRSDLKCDLNGRLFVNTASPQMLSVHLDGSSAYTDQALFADPGDGFQVVMTSIQISTGAATALNMFLEEGSTKVWGPVYLQAVAGVGYVSGPIHKPFTASTAVTVTTSASIAQSIDATYYVQAV